MTTVKVYFDDCQGNLANGTLVHPSDWSEWAKGRVAKGENRGVVLVDGVEHVVVPVIEATRIYWKAI